MAYDFNLGIWNEATRHVMNATGCSKEEAQDDICQALLMVSSGFGAAKEARHQAYDFEKCT